MRRGFNKKGREVKVVLSRTNKKERLFSCWTLVGISRHTSCFKRLYRLNLLNLQMNPPLTANISPLYDGKLLIQHKTPSLSQTHKLRDRPVTRRQPDGVKNIQRNGLKHYSCECSNLNQMRTCFHLRLCLISSHLYPRRPFFFCLTCEEHPLPHSTNSSSPEETRTRRRAEPVSDFPFTVKAASLNDHVPPRVHRDAGDLPRVASQRPSWSRQRHTGETLTCIF